MVERYFARRNVTSQAVSYWKKPGVSVVKNPKQNFYSSPSQIPNSHSLENAKGPLSRLDHKDWLAPNEALKLFTYIGEPEVVLHAFEKVSLRKDYKPNESLYRVIIEKLASADKLSNAQKLVVIEDLLQRSKEENCRLSDEFFYRLIKIYSNILKHPKQAIETLLKMPDFHCWPSVKTFNSVLNMLVSEKQYDVIHEVYLSAPKLGVKVDTCTFNILLKGLCQMGKLESGLVLLEELPQQGCRPNVTTYSTLMHGLCKHNKVQEAFNLFDKMESDGCYPDSIMFNILISGLCRQGLVDQANQLLFKMQLKGCAPNPGSYQALLNGLLSHGKVVEAKDFMVQMVSKGINPTFLSYKMAINELCKQNLLNEVDWVLKQMVLQGLLPRMGIWKKILESMSLSKNCPELSSMHKS